MSSLKTDPRAPASERKQRRGSHKQPALATVGLPSSDASPTFYVRRLRPLFNALLVLGILPAALVCGVPIALLNWFAFRDARQILFVQPRVGLRGRVFSIYKFRTMRSVNQSAMDSWSAGGDAQRVTRLGRTLRNMHLDELPQLINVLKGDMDMIGPRPEMVEVHAWACENVDGFSRRLNMRPGLTGLAQITQGYTGRDIDAYAEKLAIDQAYIERRSLALDLAIVGRTVVWMLRGKGWGWKSKRPTKQPGKR